MTDREEMKHPWKHYLLLLCLSTGIYLFYFSHQLLHLNSILSSVTGDSVKNYYTYIFHIKHDPDFLNFRGMNYPFGEHVAYTDCQPLLTWVLRPLTFFHEHLIGILHALLFGSFIVTPLIVLRLLQKLGTGLTASCFFSLGLSVLSPLFLKILWGHFALAYSWTVPLLFILFIDFQRRPSLANGLSIFIYNLLFFLIHPYTGLSCCIFTMIGGMFYFILEVNFSKARLFLATLFIGVLPVIIFRIFMLYTDHHTGRSPEPMNHDSLTANWGCLLVPSFGPLGGFLQLIFQTAPSNYEGYCYLGVILILYSILLLPIFFFRKGRIFRDRMPWVIGLSALVMLFISFGWVADLLKSAGIESNSLKQFRAIARLDIFFYYGLAVLIFSLGEQVLCSFFSQWGRKIAIGCSVLYAAGNIFEAGFMFKMGQEAMWRFPNFFSSHHLLPEQRKMLDLMRSHNVQAITTLPLFLYGSEVIDRDNWNYSMIPSMLFSSHNGLPIIGSNMSRTSVTEAEHVLNLFNFYRRPRGLSLLDERPVFVLKTDLPLLPVEERTAQRAKWVARNDTLEFGMMSLSVNPIAQTPCEATIKAGAKVISDSLIYIPTAENKPFRLSRLEDYEKIYTLDSNKLKPGMYVLSFHYHYDVNTHRGLACNLIMTSNVGGQYQWFYNDGIKRLAARYSGFGIYEIFVEIREATQYEFLLKGTQPGHYRISDFMIRRKESDICVEKGKDTLINNFPVSAP